MGSSLLLSGIMKLSALAPLAVLFCFLAVAQAGNFTTIVSGNGYPVQEYDDVLTKDGYYLTTFRMQGKTHQSPKGVILLGRK